MYLEAYIIYIVFLCDHKKKIIRSKYIILCNFQEMQQQLISCVSVDFIVKRVLDVTGPGVLRVHSVMN
jgi:hypothetical protein